MRDVPNSQFCLLAGEFKYEYFVLNHADHNKMISRDQGMGKLDHGSSVLTSMWI